MSSNKFLVTVGISGSGKSYYAKNLVKTQNFVNVNNDDLRRSLFGIDQWSEYNFNLNEAIIDKVRSDIINRLLNDSRNIIVSNVHLSERHLRKYKDLADKFNYSFKVILFDVPVNICLERNQRRSEMKLSDKRIVIQHALFSKIYQSVLDNYDCEIIKWRK